MSHNLFLHPSSFHNNLSHHIAVLVCPCSIRLPPQQSSNRIKPCSSAQFVTHVSGCPLLPISRSDLFQKHFLHVTRANKSHVHPVLSAKQQCVPLRPLDAQVTSLAHNSSCKSSHLSPILKLENLLPASLLWFCKPFTNPNSFCPRLRGRSGKLFLNFEIIHL